MIDDAVHDFTSDDVTESEMITIWHDITPDNSDQAVPHSVTNSENVMMIPLLILFLC